MTQSTPKDSDAMEALAYIEEHTKYLSSIHPVYFSIIRAALQPPAAVIDVMRREVIDVMRREVPDYDESNCDDCIRYGSANGYNQALDDIAARFPQIVGRKS